MIQNIRKKIKIFFITNRLIRKIKLFFGRNIFPLFFKAIIALITLIILAIIGLKTFKPGYLERVQHRAGFYLLHYLNFDNHDYGEINIAGNNRTSREEIVEIVKEVKRNITVNSDQDYQPLIQKLVAELKKKLPWVGQVVVTRNMPDILNITVLEYEPFAIWEDGKIKYITNRDGDLVLIDDLSEFEGLVILSGKGANTHARSLFNIFAIDPELSSKIYSATWIGGRRWDIRFESGLLIKLPESNISKAWQNLIKIYNMPGSVNGLKTIDLRISNKIYLEYDDSAIKELKNI
jgi:cell division septal protein FtsQ